MLTHFVHEASGKPVIWKRRLIYKHLCLWLPLQLKGFELIKNILVEPTPFDMERDLLTPTYKIMRPKMLKYYQKEIDGLYQEIRNEGTKK